MFLEANTELRRLQTASFGPDHPDLARTHQDTSIGLRILMKAAPGVFATSDFPCSADPSCAEPFPPADWSSLERAKRAEHNERRQYERIRALYSGY
jgi:hypothetical protein